MLHGNETLMIQVLQNLIVNGLRYNKSKVPRVDVSANSEDESWVIEVRDNGIGIAPEYQAEIFKPLIRLHSHKEYPGSGLGLTLARKAIVAQKGEIWCESERRTRLDVLRPPRRRRQETETQAGIGREREVGSCALLLACGEKAPITAPSRSRGRDRRRASSARPIL